MRCLEIDNLEKDKLIKKSEYERAKQVAQCFGINVIEKSDLKGSARWYHGENRIFINSRRADFMDILHEIGHFIIGTRCCREHDEYLAHGVAIGLAKSKGFIISQEDVDRIDYYANWSVCPIEECDSE